MDEDIEVAYLGPPGTYSHQVALSLYPTTRGDGSQEASTSRVTLTPYATITDAAHFAVAPADGGSRRRRLALLPLKNSTHGIVKETEAFLASSPVAVQRVKTVKFAVKHALLVNRKTYERLQSAGGREESNEGTISDEALKSIEKVYSHEQALGQCRHFLDSHLPLTSAPGNRVNVSSTALAASMIAQEEAEGDDARVVAAIASGICATEGIYDDVRVARVAIQDRDDNVTTFILIRASASKEQ